MTSKSKMTAVSTKEMREATGGINAATIGFLQRTHKLTKMQVSALKYYNKLGDPAKYEGFLPQGPGTGIPGATPQLG